MNHRKIFNDQAAILENEIFANSIIPSTRTEMWRRVELYGNSQVKGGIFGDTLLADEGNVFVRDACYLRDYVHIQTKGKNFSWFHSVVAAGNSIDKKNTGARTRFSSDLHAKSINLNNCMIYGNIVCDNAILEDCIVLGGVFAKGSLTVGNCVLGTFKAEALTQKGTIGILQPFALCASIKGQEGKIYNLMPFKKLEGRKATVYEIVEDDIIDRTFKDNQGNERRWYVFSAGKRVFDLSDYLQSTADNLHFIEKSVGIESDDLPGLDMQLKQFDDYFYSFLERHFEMEYDIPVSHFMESTLRYVPSLPPPSTNEKLEEGPAAGLAPALISGYTVNEITTGETLGEISEEEFETFADFLRNEPGDPGRYRIDKTLVEFVKVVDKMGVMPRLLEDGFTRLKPESDSLELRIVPVVTGGGGSHS
jgi:hypothetical protein